jgi:hypothetical protein
MAFQSPSDEGAIWAFPWRPTTPELNPGVNTFSSGLCVDTGVVHARPLAAADLAQHSDA